MYEFTDLKQKTTGEGVYINPEAPMFDFGFIESQIEGYKTISVTGREMIGKNVNIVEFEGFDGGLYNYSNYTTRTIRVNYMLESNTSYNLLQKFQKLNYLLRKEQFLFTFNDEKTLFYQGTVQEVDEIDSGRLNVKGSFTILCSDPFKYSSNKELVNTNVVDLTSLNSQYNLRLNRIEIKPTTNLTDLKIDFTGNKKYDIILLGSYTTADTITLDFINNTIKKGNTNILNNLSWESDFENITIDNTTVITSNNSNIKVVYNDKIL